MIPLILEYLHSSLSIKIPAAFHYTSTRMMLAALTTLFISIFCGPWFIRKLYELKIGQSIRSDECPLLGELHAKKKDTPTMGGLLILFAMVAALLIWMDLTHVFTLILLIATLGLGILGGIDDYLKLKYKNTKGLSGRKKLAGQLLLSGFVACYLLIPTVSESLHVGQWFDLPVIKEEVGTRDVSEQITLQNYASRLYVPFMKDPVFIFSGISAVAVFLLIILVITGSSNAVNLTDGLDGLAAGCLLMVAVCLSLIAFLSNHHDLSQYLNIPYVEGSGEIAVFLCGFAGACLGFLWYNGHPAQVFMGDTGSLTLGGLIGVCAVLLKRELLLAIIGGVFVAEAMSVIVQVGSFRLRNKKRVLLCAPLHHHFEYKGWAETKVVIRFWIVSLLLAMIGMLSLKFQ
jgi:phospho-N-acetylmuramoyl-pentapeptide-transferase